MLSTDHYQKSVRYIQQEARPLEKALYAYHFEGGSKDTVLNELAAYQNEDGGFGNALEPDVRLPDSSVLATIFAFQKFREIDAPPTHPMVKRAADYLLKTYQPKHKNWQLIPPNVDDAPHAPWWSYADETLYFCNGQCIEIVAYAYDYPNLFPADLRDTLTTSLISRVASYHPDLDAEDGTYLLTGYLKVLETKNLPREVYTALLESLTRMVKASVQPKPAFWGKFGFTPLSVITSRRSPFYPLYEHLIPQNTGHLRETIHADGYWVDSSPWSFEVDAAAARAEYEYRGIHTLSTLLLLREFAEMVNQ